MLIISRVTSILCSKRCQIVIFWPYCRHDTLQKTVLTGRIDGRGGRGRPRRQWYDIRGWTSKQLYTNIKLAQDRGNPWQVDPRMALISRDDNNHKINNSKCFHFRILVSYKQLKIIYDTRLE